MLVAVVLLGEDLAVGIIPAKQSQAYACPITCPPPVLVPNDAPPSLALIANTASLPRLMQGPASSLGGKEGTMIGTR